MSIIEKTRYYARALFAMKIAKSATVSYMPEYVAIEVTNVCNFKCAFCPQSDPKHHQLVPRTYLDEETCELFLKKIRAAGVRSNLIHWTLDGDPFMNKGFAGLCQLAVAHGFTNCHFATNGMLCTVERLKEFPLERCRLNLCIDFCADPKYFEEVRGTRNSWTTVQSNIESILANERCGNVYIEITDISSFSDQDPHSLRQKFEQLQATFRPSPRLTFRTRTFHNATGYLSIGKKKNATAGKYHLCPYPWTTLRVASNGDIVACCRDLQHKTVLGSLKTQELGQIWNGAPMQTLRRNLLDGSPDRSAACQGCDLPHDDSKFTVKNIYRAVKGRMQFFNN
jgi:radical SAM protein with 4Fe4S-binding SPASM domain